MMRPPRQSGFAILAAIVLVVLLAGMAAVIVRMNTSQQTTVNLDLLGIRASQAARSGVEWGLYRVRAGACPAAQTSLADFRAETGFTVTVSCSVNTFNEGESVAGTALQKRFFRIEAVACNGTAGACPDAAAVGSLEYVERRRVATACMTSTLGDCY